MEKVNSILTPKTILHLTNLLKELDWFLAVDDKTNSIISELKWQGLSRDTLNEPKNNLHERLNDFGLIITENVCQRIYINQEKKEFFIQTL